MRFEATKNSPEVDLTFDDGRGWIRGTLRVAYGNIAKLFGDITVHMADVLQNDQGRFFSLEIFFEELPTTAHQHIRELMDMIQKHLDSGVDVQVTWYYPSENEMMKQSAASLHDLYPKLVRIEQGAA